VAVALANSEITAKLQNCAPACRARTSLLKIY